MNKLMLFYLAVNFFFLACGGLILGFSLVSEQQEKATPTVANVAYTLLLTECPLTAGVVNSIFVFITFLLSLPALAMPNSRSWLKVQAWGLIVCSIFTLVLGLVIWFDTLETRRNLAVIWGQQSMQVQALLQERFQCCGYLNSVTPPFVQDAICPNAQVAATKMGCVGPFSSFANIYLDLIFTAAFGIVGVDVLLLLCVVMVIKYREEQERYRHIDEKVNGF
ncbi:tetraspanin [Microthyrium microscopicum]|uniref:Tetraspanin n=1 Tax=Microthyrium microscopicum TaxID=703497 RepID=A0A6A6UBA3_9PEZI|nr:tetraspanin [Microthyrium microscopicum]